MTGVMPRFRLTKAQRGLFRGIILHLVLVSLGIIFLIPFLWMLSTALKKPEQIWLIPPVWIPRPIMWSNIAETVRTMKFGLYLKNTVIVTSLNMIGAIITSTFVAYGFTRFRFKGRNFLFMLLLSTMMIPGQVTIIPTFIIFTKLGWINTFKPLTIPVFFGIPFYIFLLRQFFMTIPRELDEAAIIDGCGYPGIYWRVILPLSKPAVATVAIFQFMASWNDFFGPLVYLNETEKYTLALGLATFRGLYSTQWNLLMVASVLAMLPCLLLFFLAQRYFIQGVTLTGMKG